MFTFHVTNAVRIRDQVGLRQRGGWHGLEQMETILSENLLRPSDHNFHQLRDGNVVGVDELVDEVERRWRVQHARTDADGQVERRHLVVVRIDADVVEDAYEMPQQELVTLRKGQNETV